MKRIEAIIRPGQLPFVKQALEDIGHGGITVAEVKGHGKQKGVTEQWRGRQYKVDYLSKVWLLIVVQDAQAEAVIDAILDAAATGEIGDGKIFVFDVESALRIRTGETGDNAL